MDDISKELFFNENDLIVSMTDKKGIITYANDVFFKVAQYERGELIGKPHNIIRHPDMPKVVFKLVWDRLLNNQEVYGFVKNKSKRGNFYWVYAFLKPIVVNGEITKIISYRKQLNEYAKKIISSIYAALLEYEKTHTIDETMAFLVGYLQERELDYDTFVERLAMGQNVTNVAAMKIDFQRFYNDHVIFKQNILDKVKANEPNIVVADPCCCNFGKWLEGAKNEPYATHKAWSDVHKHHNHVHSKLQEYVNASKADSSIEEKNNILEDIKHDTEEIFANVRTVMNYCE